MMANGTSPHSPTPPPPAEDPQPSVFVTTHWSVVLTAARNDSTRSLAALENLCRAYWHPVYHYVRRRGYGPQDAQDLTQSFFANLLERRSLAKADPQRGRFRSFLLASAKNFLADQWDKTHARKRGAVCTFALDFQSEEVRLPREAVDDMTPDKAYERRWAIALLDQVYRKLADEFSSQGKGDQFAALRVTLTAPRGTTPYANLAEQLDLSEGAVKVAVHRLRRRYRELLRTTIAETVSTSEEVEDELRYLLHVMAR